jgi:hypothetical protein
MTGSFTLVSIPDDPDPAFVYIEHTDGAVYLERPVDLAAYGAAFDAVTKLALSPRESREFLVALSV